MEKLLGYFDLSNNEKKVFIHLLENGALSATAISKNLKINRNTCLEYLRSLQAKGLLYSAKVGKKFYYQNEDPDKLSQIINERMFLVDKILPKLKERDRKAKIKVRALNTREVGIEKRRFKRKGKLQNSFGAGKVGGYVRRDEIILFSELEEMPGLKIESEEIANFHKKLLD